MAKTAVPPKGAVQPAGGDQAGPIWQRSIAVGVVGLLTLLVGLVGLFVGRELGRRECIPGDPAQGESSGKEKR